MIEACSPRGSSWPADFRSEAVRLYRDFEAGLISMAELQSQLGEKFPDRDVPDSRTLRRWAHERYANLPELRQEFFGRQAARTVTVDEVSRLMPVLRSFMGYYMLIGMFRHLGTV